MLRYEYDLHSCSTVSIVMAALLAVLPALLLASYTNVMADLACMTTVADSASMGIVADSTFMSSVAD